MVEILYGKGSMTCPVEPDAVLTAHGSHEKPVLSGKELVRRAMAAPIGTEPLSVLAKGKQRAALIISECGWYRGRFAFRPGFRDDGLFLYPKNRKYAF